MPTLTDQLVAFFQAQPGVKVDARDLAARFGFAAWRTRVSDARRLHGLDIRNQWTTARREDGRPYRVSVYWLACEAKDGEAA